MQIGYGQCIHTPHTHTHTHTLVLIRQNEQHPLVRVQTQLLLSHNTPIPWNTVQIQKLGVFLASQEFFRSWSTLLTIPHHLSLPWITWVQVQILPSCFFMIHFNIILQFVSSFYNQLSLSRSRTFSCLVIFLYSLSARLVLVDFIILWLEGRFMKILIT